MASDWVAGAVCPRGNLGGLVRLNPHGSGEVCSWEEGRGPWTVAGAARFLHLDCRGAHLCSPLLFGLLEMPTVSQISGLNFVHCCYVGFSLGELARRFGSGETFTLCSLHLMNPCFRF